MSIDRITELCNIINDASDKMDIIEARVDKGGLDLDKQFHLLDMFYMNMDRRMSAKRELKKLRS